jgi:hypothetical protein
MTARSQSTWPGSCAERRSRVLASAALKPSVSPSRCVVRASRAVPAREERPIPSAATPTVLNELRPITFKVNLLSGWVAGLVTAILPAQADVSGLSTDLLHGCYWRIEAHMEGRLSRG